MKIYTRLISVFYLFQFIIIFLLSFLFLSLSFSISFYLFSISLSFYLLFSVFNFSLLYNFSNWFIWNCEVSDYSVSRRSTRRCRADLHCRCSRIYICMDTFVLILALEQHRIFRQRASFLRLVDVWTFEFSWHLWNRAMRVS